MGKILRINIVLHFLTEKLSETVCQQSVDTFVESAFAMFEHSLGFLLLNTLMIKPKATHYLWARDSYDLFGSHDLSHQ
jgi:hypothetical protein